MKVDDNSGHRSPSVAVIGAGPCGITTVKNLLQHHLTNVVVFEKNSEVGGNWVFDEANDHSSVYETTHIISSKRLSQYDDFPMPEHYPDYPSHKELRQYFNDYADHFDIRPYIRFRTVVENVVRLSTGQWQIVYRDDQGEHAAIFDYVLIANGHHWDPFMPDYPGDFSGARLHAHQYKRSAPFKNKRVLVVGGGNSACDIAVETARVSDKVCLSMRNGQHIFPKFMFGKPTDMAFAKISWMPHWCKQRLTSAVIRILQGRYAKYQLKKPESKPLDVHPTINSELLYFIRHGKISPRDAIERFEGDTVCFADGRKEAFDTIIFATGYKISFPFFSEDLIDYGLKTQIPLYRKMMHPELDTLYFIGLFQPQGCIWPLADHQANIVAQIIKGTLKRPSKLDIKIKKEVRASQNRFKESPRHALEVNYHAFRKQLLADLRGTSVAL